MKTKKQTTKENKETLETFKKYQYRKVGMVINGALVGLIAGVLTILTGC
jgi:TRAP-type uncharacterized transport system fused permease subunit